MPLYELQPNTRVSIEFGVIEHIDYDSYLMDIFLVSRMKRLSKVPISAFNSFNSLGITVVPTVNQEVIVLIVESGPVVVLPFVIRRHKLVGTVHRPFNAHPGDIYLINQGSQLFLFEDRVQWQVGALDAPPDIVFQLQRSEGDAPATTRLNTPNLVVFNDNSLLQLDKSLTYMATDGESNTASASLNQTGLTINVEQANTTSQLQLSATELQLNFGEKTTLLLRANGSAQVKTGDALIEIDQSGKVRIHAKQLEIATSSTSVQTEELSIRGQHAMFEFENLSMQTQKFELSASQTNIHGNVSVDKALRIGGNIESFGKIECDSLNARKITITGQDVAVLNSVRRAIGDLYMSLSSMANQFNVHTHGVIAPSVPTTQPLNPMLPGSMPTF